MKTISRGMKINKICKILLPAQTVVLDRAPESLVLLSKGTKVFDHYDHSVDQKAKKGRVWENWSFTA